MSLGIRARVMLLVLAAALPAAALAIYDALESRAADEARGRADAVRLATMAARHHGQIVEGARQTLVAMAQAIPLLPRSGGACNEYLAYLRQESGGLYHSLGLLADGGELICSAVPWRGKVNSADRLYYRRALASGRFSAGEYQHGRVTQRDGISFGFPMRLAGGAPAVGFIALDLEHFERIAKATPLPARGVIGVIDENGVILAQHPARPGAIGKQIPFAAVLDRVLAAPSGVFEAAGAGAVPKLFAFQAVMANADGSIPLRVVVSTPLEVIYADGNAALTRNLAALAIATLVLLAAAWYATDRLIVRSIRRLVDVARRLHRGDFAARTGFEARGDEMSEIGAAFDGMAHALQARDAALRRTLEELHEQSMTDALTGLHNRRYLLERLSGEMARAARHGRPLAVLLLDVDHFKRINDGCGHAAGDAVLSALGALLRRSLRAEDLAGRYGGEEFVVALSDASLEAAVEKAEALRAAVALLEVEGAPALSASIGVAAFPAHGAEPAGVLDAADQALYAAKRGGRNRVCAARGEERAA